MILTMVIIYLAIMILIGYFYRKKAGSGEEGFLVANRSIPAWLGGGALASTYTSTSGFLGILGLMFAAGIAPALWGNIGLLLGFIIAMVFVAPQIRKSKIVTFPQFFEQRFNKKVRAVAAVVTVITMFVYMIAQIQGGAFAIQYVLGINYELAVAVIGLVFIAYVALGGSYASIATSFWQNLMMILAMVAVALIVILSQDWSQIVTGSVSNNPIAINIWGGPGPLFSLSFGLLLSLGVICSPHVVMRYSAAIDEKTAVKTTSSAITYLSVFYLATVFVGLYLVANFPEVSNPDMGFFLVVEELFPKVVIGLFVATVIAAAMSTTDAQLLTAASAITTDLYPILFKKDLPKDKAVKATRWIVIIIGLLTILVTLRPPELIFLVMALAQSLIIGAFLCPLLLGLWWKKTTSQGAFIGMIGGFMASALLSPAMGLVNLPSPFLSGPAGALVSLLLTVFISLSQQKTESRGLIEEDRKIN
ncbi:sodium:solute symporter family protein [Aquibacillus saliphilus]|uniref:sodium:solute symporter family protein n=1 Tax=Aquibacillus saliphilus TaxID=1909422 RepID=UPI001CF0BCF6|nr:sodium/solute symporter [Aquibacillus saliphilus]